jgi:hypothetical protein
MNNTYMGGSTGNRWGRMQWIVAQKLKKFLIEYLNLMINLLSLIFILFVKKI